MGSANVNLASLIGARICHDLISPIGAINNGLELMGMAGGAGPEMDLIAQSVENAAARIRFFRIAFGAAGGHPVARTEVAGILRDFYGDGRVSAEWRDMDDPPRCDVRLAFLAILCCEQALPQGGTIVVARNDDAWTISAEGAALRPDAALWSRLGAPCPDTDVTPAYVQFALLPVIASDLGRVLSVQADAGSARITLRAAPPR